MPWLLIKNHAGNCLAVFEGFSPLSIARHVGLFRQHMASGFRRATVTPYFAMGPFRVGWYMSLHQLALPCPQVHATFLLTCCFEKR